MTEAPLSSHQRPPLIAERFLMWCLPEELKEPILGDLEEEFHQLVLTKQSGQAVSWYLNQAFKTGMQFIWKTQQGLLMFIIGTILFLGLMFMGMLFGGGAWLYLDIPSALMVFPPAIVFAIAATSIASFKNGIAVLGGADGNLEEKDFMGAAYTFAVMGTSAIWIGLAATLIGWVAMAANIKVEEFTQVIGPAFAVSVLTIMYAMIMKVMCYVAEQKILYRMNQIA